MRVSRKIVGAEFQGARMVGVVHQPLGRRQQLGLLLLNAGPAPRAGNSDLSVHLADAAARLGVPAFRFDLPGLGDSTGDVPELMAEYWQEVLDGRNTDATRALVATLTADYSLSGLIVGGLCAGAVIAIRAAAREPADVAGLLLLEPALRRDERQTAPLPTDVERPSEPSPFIRRLKRAGSTQSWLHYLTGSSRAARVMRPLHPLFRRWLLRLVGNDFPSTTNLPLALELHEVMASGRPVLLMTAQGDVEEEFLGRLLERLPQRDRAVLRHESVPGTNHIFTAGAGRRLAMAAETAWLREVLGLPEEGDTSDPIARCA